MAHPMCKRCGVLVGNKHLHDDFHDTLELIAAGIQVLLGRTNGTESQGDAANAADTIQRALKDGMRDMRGHD